MNTNPHQPSRDHRPKDRVPRIACLLAFPLVAITGWWIHVCVLPLPVQSLLAGIARFTYFLVWLGTLFFLLGTAVFGYQSRGWQVIVYLLFGLLLGVYGGYFFAGPLGIIVGAFSGLLLGPIIFFVRRDLNKRRLDKGLA